MIYGNRLGFEPQVDENMGIDWDKSRSVLEHAFNFSGVENCFIRLFHTETLQNSRVAFDTEPSTTGTWRPNSIPPPDMSHS